jgi:outer membrane lipoprotein-sorting protein
MSSAAILAQLLLLMSLAAPQGSARAARAPGDLFAEIYQRGVVKQRAMKSIRANFTETTVSSLLVKPIVARGTVVAAPPARVRMTYAEPEAKTVTMDGRSLVVAWPARGEREQIDIREMKQRIDRYFTNASIDELRKLFEITAEPDAALRRADRVTMTPKRKQIKQGLQQLDLWIDRESDLLVQMRLSFPGGDQKTIALEDILVALPNSHDTFRP